MKMAIRFFMNRNNVRSITIFYAEVVKIFKKSCADLKICSL